MSTNTSSIDANKVQQLLEWQKEPHLATLFVKGNEFEILDNSGICSVIKGLALTIFCGYSICNSTAAKSFIDRSILRESKCLYTDILTPLEQPALVIDSRIALSRWVQHRDKAWIFCKDNHYVLVPKTEYRISYWLKGYKDVSTHSVVYSVAEKILTTKDALEKSKVPLPDLSVPRPTGESSVPTYFATDEKTYYLGNPFNDERDRQPATRAGVKWLIQNTPQE